MPSSFPTTLDGFLNPSQTTNLDGSGSDPRLRHSSQHDNLNDAVSAIETKVGTTLSSVTTSLDYIITLLLLATSQHSKGVRRDIQGGFFPTNVVWFADPGATIKLVEKKYTYDGNKNITKVELFLYDGSGANNITRTITDNITLSGPFETSRTRTVT